jgi:hypothetical protein
VSISGDGNTIVVGALDIPSTGAVYVFAKPQGGWKNATETAKLTSDVPSGITFGLGTAINNCGDTVFAGAVSNNYPGAVYVHRRTGKQWKSTSQYAAKLTVTGSTALGNPLALSQDGNTLLTGANDGISGAAYIFVYEGRLGNE